MGTAKTVVSPLITILGYSISWRYYVKIYVYTELEPGLQAKMKERLSDHDVSFRNESPSEDKFQEAEILLGNPPKKYPINRKLVTHAIPPTILKVANFP